MLLHNQYPISMLCLNLLKQHHIAVSPQVFSLCYYMQQNIENLILLIYLYHPLRLVCRLRQALKKPEGTMRSNTEIAIIKYNKPKTISFLKLPDLYTSQSTNGITSIEK